MNKQTAPLTMQIEVDETLLAALTKLLRQSELANLQAEEIIVIGTVQIRAAHLLKEARRSNRATLRDAS